MLLRQPQFAREDESMELWDIILRSNVGFFYYFFSNRLAELGHRGILEQRIHSCSLTMSSSQSSLRGCFAYGLGMLTTQAFRYHISMAVEADKGIHSETNADVDNIQ